MSRFAVLAASFALLAATLTAQEPVPSAASKAAPLVFAPGALDLAGMIRQAAQHVGETAEIEAGPAIRIPLQNPLRLDRADCKIVVSRIAAAHGVLLQGLGTQQKWIRTAGKKRKALFAAAQPVTPKQLLTERRPEMFVRTRLVTKKAQRLVAKVGPYFSFSDRALRVSWDRKDGVDLVGTRRAVRGALRLIRAVQGHPIDTKEDDPAGAALAATEVTGKRAVWLQRGRHQLTTVLGKLAVLHGTNHLYDPADLKGCEIELTSSLRVAKANAIAAVSEYAAECGVSCVPVAARHGVFEWVRTKGKRRRLAESHALFLSPATVHGLAGLRIAVETAVRKTKDMNIRAVRWGQDLTMGQMGKDLVVLRGNAPQVAAALTALGK